MRFGNRGTPSSSLLIAMVPQQATHRVRLLSNRVIQCPRRLPTTGPCCVSCHRRARRAAGTIHTWYYRRHRAHAPRFTLGCPGSFTSWRTPQARCLPPVRPPIPARLQEGRKDQTIGQGVGPRVLGARRNVYERETPTSRRTAGSDPADLRRDPLSVFASHRERSVRAVLRPLRSASQVSTAARSAWPRELVAVMDGQGSPWCGRATSLEQHRADVAQTSPLMSRHGRLHVTGLLQQAVPKRPDFNS